MFRAAVVMLIEVNYLRSLGLSFGPTNILSGLSCLVFTFALDKLIKPNKNNTKINNLFIYQ